MRAHPVSLAFSLALALFAAMTWEGIARAADAIELKSGFSKVVKLDRVAQTVAIGNPEVADATVNDGRTIIFTAKGIGVTNVIFLDQAGSEISSLVVRVSSSHPEQVLVRSGHAGRKYLCTPGCELVGVIGDQSGSPASPAVQRPATESPKSNPPP